MERKILIAIDNTELDNVTVKYLSNLFKGVSDRVLANINNAALWVVG
jgi:hypothetical protein